MRSREREREREKQQEQMKEIKHPVRTLGAKALETEGRPSQQSQ